LVKRRIRSRKCEKNADWRGKESRMIYSERRTEPRKEPAKQEIQM